MILIDSSVWIEFLRPRGNSEVHDAVAAIIIANQAATCGPIRMEVLGVARFPERRRITEDFDKLHYISNDEGIWEEAIFNAWIIRGEGYNIPWNDILIATVARRKNIGIYSLDKHFAMISEVLGLRRYIPLVEGAFNSDY